MGLYQNSIQMESEFFEYPEPVLSKSEKIGDLRWLYDRREKMNNRLENHNLRIHNDREWYINMLEIINKEIKELEIEIGQMD